MVQGVHSNPKEKYTSFVGGLWQRFESDDVPTKIHIQRVQLKFEHISGHKDDLLYSQNIDSDWDCCI